MQPRAHDSRVVCDSDLWYPHATLTVIVVARFNSSVIPTYFTRYFVAFSTNFNRRLLNDTLETFQWMLCSADLLNINEAQNSKFHLFSWRSAAEYATDMDIQNRKLMAINGYCFILTPNLVGLGQKQWS